MTNPKIGETDLFLISYKEKSELFFANDNKYVSVMLKLDELKELRKKVTEEIIRIQVKLTSDKMLCNKEPF